MELPPQRLKQEVRTLAANQDIQSLRDSAALETFGSRLPVLQAFQEFVEVERKRSQKRLRLLALSFLAVLLLLGVIGALVARHYTGQVRLQMVALESALASSGQETTALRDQTSLLQRWVEEARQELAAVRETLSARPEPVPVAPAPAGPDLTPVLGLLQEIHRLRTEQTDLALRHARMQDALRQVDEVEADRIAREPGLRSAQADWLKAAADLVNRQQALAVRLAAMKDLAPAAEVVVQHGKKRGKSAAPEPAPVAIDANATRSLLEEINQLRSEPPLLEARKAEVLHGLALGALERRQGAERRAKLASDIASLSQAMTDLQTRHLGVQTRLDDVKTALSAPAAVAN